MENQNQKQLLIQKTSIKDKNELYEMVYDPIDKKTSFIKIDSSGKREHFLEEVNFYDKRYVPLSADNVLIEKGVVLFPSQPTPYNDEKDLLDEIRAFIHKYLDVTEVFEQIATYYVLFTWMYDKFNEVPYLRALGDFGTGKSRFLQTIGSLCYKPIFTAGATTTSPIFRIIDEIGGTLVMDESDFRYSDMTSDMVKILNTGYQKGTPVLRSEGKGVFEVKAYNVFSPKIIATRESFTDKALESRFLVEEMGVGKCRNGIPMTLGKDFENDALNIRNKLLMWRLDNYFIPTINKEERIEGIHPRLNQIIVPLLTIIKDEDAKAKLKEFIIKYNVDLVEDRGLTWESDIVYAILKYQFDNKITEMTVKNITDVVNFEMDTDDTITARKVGWYLRTKLQLKTEKKRNGFMLSLIRNEKKIAFWKERFGITDAEISGEHVNEVNVVDDEEDIENMIKESNPF